MHSKKEQAQNAISELSQMKHEMSLHELYELKTSKDHEQQSNQNRRSSILSGAESKLYTDEAIGGLDKEVPAT